MTLYITTVTFSMLVFLALCSEAHVSEQSPSTGFSVDLISREFSPLSPFYNPKATHFERLKNVIHRSNSRLSYLQFRLNSPPSKSPASISSTLQWSDLEYLMKLNIGTPPVEYLVIADTGSDLTWIQCKPCIDCFKQAYPLFDSRKSSSYKTLKCGSKCTKYITKMSGLLSLCNPEKNKCLYLSTYGDGSYTVGDGATEKLTFGKTSIPNFIFGCGHLNNGIFGNMCSGIVGLGGGPSSLINQLDYIIHGKFSYCMVSYEKNETSTIRFGGEGVRFSTPKAVLTPLFYKPDDTSYYVNLEKVIIGNKSFELPWEMTIPQVQPGNMVIDSGTAVTKLPDGAFYEEIVSALKEYIGLKTTDDPNNLLDLCYKTSLKIKVPYIAFQFTGGTLSIPSTSAFKEVASDVTCFSIMPSSGALSLLGNILQQNFLVSYDLPKNMVSFLPTDCSKK